jgi:hypothetical protein
VWGSEPLNGLNSLTTEWSKIVVAVRKNNAFETLKECESIVVSLRTRLALSPLRSSVQCERKLETDDVVIVRRRRRPFIFFSENNLPDVVGRS